MLKPLKAKDKSLRAICEEVSLKELKTKEFQKLIDNMLELVYGTNNKGFSSNKIQPMTVGLSANQVGIMKKISIVDLAIGRRAFSDVHVLINPKITWKSKTIVYHREGCVNLPEIWGVIPRSKRVKVEAIDRSGNKIFLDLTGWPAVLLQHEVDHLNGKLFIDHLPDFTKAHFVKKDDMVKYRKEYKNWKYFVDVSELGEYLTITN